MANPTLTGLFCKSHYEAGGGGAGGEVKTTKNLKQERKNDTNFVMIKNEIAEDQIHPIESWFVEDKFSETFLWSWYQNIQKNVSELLLSFL